MTYPPDDTICAIATAPGGAARSIVRVSGPAAIDVVARIFRSADGTRLEDIRLPTVVSGCASVALHGDRIHNLPCDAFIWPTARSYTREPVVELYTLGSPPLVESLLVAICRAGARLAEPGEFTLRAFLAGRIDLTQAEAVLGVIDARSNDELMTSLTQLAGGLARPLQQLREELLQLLAELEAGLDFVDEDIEFISKETLLERLKSASQLLSHVAEQMTSRDTAAASAQVALVGPPNAGKSSLFNAIVARYSRHADSFGCKPTPAIVSSRPGTTRDYLTATIEIDGARFELLDTAGVDLNLPLPSGESRVARNPPWRGEGTSVDESHVKALLQFENSSDVDFAAQALAAERRAVAAIRVFCVDPTAATPNTSSMPRIDTDLASCEIVAITKVDLKRAPQQRPALPHGVAIVNTSSRTGEGLDELCSHIHALLGTDAVAQQAQTVASTAERCRESIRLAQSTIVRAIEIVDQESGDELAAAELRIALNELGKVVGAVYTDDLLDRVFSTFCIGK